MLYNQIQFFNIFKEQARNNIGIIHGFPNWCNKISYEIDGDDLLIHIPDTIMKRGSYEVISRSRRKKEIDNIMKDFVREPEDIMKKESFSTIRRKKRKRKIDEIMEQYGENIDAPTPLSYSFLDFLLKITFDIYIGIYYKDKTVSSFSIKRGN